MSQIKKVTKDVFPYLRLYDDGTVERHLGTDVTPPGFDSQTCVLSKDIVITTPETTLSARLYRPDSVPNDQKLPLLLYFHGGAFVTASPAEPKFHHCLNQLVSQAKSIAVSVDYRLAPEHPLPAAYEDSWAALQWVAEGGGTNEEWLKNYADFGWFFLAGDSAGANIAHHLALRIKDSDMGPNMKLQGVTMIHPYFWGNNPIGVEANDRGRKSIVDNWWMFVCPSDNGCDDPYINPFVDGAPSLKGLACDTILVFVAKKDILCDRGKLYYENVVKSGWEGKADIVETKGEDHGFHILNPDCENAHILIKQWASYISNYTIQAK